MKKIGIPIKRIGGADWGELSAFGPSHTHVICGEKVNQGEDISLAGGHRVRLFRFKKNVHWKIPIGVDLDITDVPAVTRRRR